MTKTRNGHGDRDVVTTPVETHCFTWTRTAISAARRLSVSQHDAPRPTPGITALTTRADVSRGGPRRRLLRWASWPAIPFQGTTDGRQDARQIEYLPGGAPSGSVPAHGVSGGHATGFNAIIDMAFHGDASTSSRNWTWRPMVSRAWPETDPRRVRRPPVRLRRSSTRRRCSMGWRPDVARASAPTRACTSRTKPSARVHHARRVLQAAGRGPPHRPPPRRGPAMTFPPMVVPPFRFAG